MLDELTAAGEVLWAGHGALAGHDGLVSLHPTAVADLTLPPLAAGRPRDRPRCTGRCSALGGGGAWFLGPLTDRVALLADPTAAARPQVGRRDRRAVGPRLGRPRHERQPRAAARMARHRVHGAPHTRAVTARPRAATPARTARGRPGRRRDRRRRRRAAPCAAGGGRWSLLPAREADPTLRAHALAAQLLDRHGILTRAVAPAEGIGARFADVYRVLSALEQGGQVRRGYFVERLGGSQFALPGAVDRLRIDAQVVERAADPDARDGAARRRPRRDRPREPLRRRARLARPPTADGGHRPGPQGRRARRPRRRRARALPRARRPDRALVLRPAVLLAAADGLAVTVRTATRAGSPSPDRRRRGARRRGAARGRRPGARRRRVRTDAAGPAAPGAYREVRAAAPCGTCPRVTCCDGPPAPRPRARRPRRRARRPALADRGDRRPRRHDRAGHRALRQAPADPVRRRPHPAHPPAHGRHWRVHATGSPQAAARSPEIRAVLATQQWTAVGHLLGMLDVVAHPRRAHLIGHLGPGPARRDGRRRRGAAPLGRPRCDAGRRGAARPAGGRGHRHHLHRRVAVRGADLAVDAGRRGRRPGTPARRRPPQMQPSVISGRPPGRVHGRLRRPCVRCGTPIAVGQARRPPDGAADLLLPALPAGAGEA